MIAAIDSKQPRVARSPLGAPAASFKGYPGCSNLALASIDTRIKIANSRLYSMLTRIHIKRGVVEISRVEIRDRDRVRWPEIRGGD